MQVEMINKSTPWIARIRPCFDKESPTFSIGDGYRNVHIPP